MYTFGKDERLKSKKIIDRLFSEGESFYLDPFLVIWLTNPEDISPASILISISKKKIRKAVVRNLLKRRIREAYRLNKIPFRNFLLEHKVGCSIAFVYTSSQIADYKDIEKKIILILQRLQSRYEESFR